MERQFHKQIISVLEQDDFSHDITLTHLIHYIPLRGCIKVAARGLKRTKVPCDYVMRTILSFDV